MKVQCLIKRVGETPVKIGDKKEYVFQPIVDLTKSEGEPTYSIATISAPADIEYLLKSGQFREYIPGQLDPEEERVVNMTGFAMERHAERGMEGYRVVDLRDKTGKMYAGLDMQWRDTVAGLSPFQSEIEAWVWLKEELKFAEDAGEPYVTKKAAESCEEKEAKDAAAKEIATILDLKKQCVALGGKVNPRWSEAMLREEILKLQDIKKG